MKAKHVVNDKPTIGKHYLVVTPDTESGFTIAKFLGQNCWETEDGTRADSFNNYYELPKHN